MLSFLKIRVIVNGSDIFPLQNTAPVLIPLTDDHPDLVVTDGFHITQPMELVFKEPSYYHFQVVCAVSDLQLLGGGFFMIVMYLLGFMTGFLILKLVSFLPILLLLFLYYVRRKEFIRLVPV